MRIADSLNFSNYAVPSQQSSIVGQYFKALNVLHVALISGQLMFAIIAFGVQKTGTLETNDALASILIYMVPILAFSCIVASNIVYQKQLSNLKDQSMSEKLQGYRAAVITRDALLEGPSLFSIISFLLTGELIFLAIPGLIIAIFFYVRPSKEKFIKELALSTNEIMTINNDNSEI